MFGTVFEKPSYGALCRAFYGLCDRVAIYTTYTE